MPSRRFLRIAPLLILFLGAAPAANAQILLGGGQGAAFSWPRYREYREFAGQGFTDATPNGRRGYFVPLGMPGYDDWGTGPSMAYSPIFNAPAPLPRPGTPTATRPRGFFRRWVGR